MKIWLPFRKKTPQVAVIRFSGTIAADGRFGSSAISDHSTKNLIEKAFLRKNLSAVALLINSPGGSPVQSSLIAARIRRLAEEKKIPVYAFVEDVAASGGYWLATAADKIYVDLSSIVGSIGVIYSGFGFQKLIKNYGIERRIHTAGEEKSFLDPFKPENAEDIDRLINLQKEIHSAFVAQVKNSRGDRLQGKDIFTGEFWVGETAKKLGLVDGIGHLIPTMKQIYGDKTKFYVQEKKKGFISRFGIKIANETIGGIENHANWSKFGL